MFSNLRTQAFSTLLLIGLVISGGCSRVKDFRFGDNWDSAASYSNPVATRIEYPTVKSCLEPEVVDVPRPLSLQNPAELETITLTLNDAIQYALANGDILRTLGGSVVASPQGTLTKFNPAIVETNPQAGVEAVLSAFDAQVAGQLVLAEEQRSQQYNVSNLPANCVPANAFHLQLCHFKNHRNRCQFRRSPCGELQP